MNAKIICQLDWNAMGFGLTILEDTPPVVTTNRMGLDLDRVILGDLVVSSGVHTFEFYVFSEKQGDLTGKVSVGIAEVGAPLDEAVGSNPESFGIRPADGEIWTNGAAVNTFDPLPERTCIGVTVDLDSSPPQVRWSSNGSSLYSHTLTAGKKWLPAFSLSTNDEDEAGDICIAPNFGTYRFDAQQQSDGWYVEPQGRDTLYLAYILEGFVTGTTDTPSNETFDPVILDPKDFVISQSPEPWPVSGGGGTPAAASIGTLKLNNRDGRFNWLLRADARGTTVIGQSIPADSWTLDDATTEFVARVDAVSAPSPTEIEVTLRDILSDLDIPCPARIIPPFADESSRGRIWPIGLGAQRNVKPMLLDAPTLTYILGDAQMKNVPLVADGGAPLDPSGSPPQYRPAFNGTCVQLDTAPVMRLSVDCSDSGEDTTVPGSDDDVLGGIGDFENWTLGVPDGWSLPTSPPSVAANGSVTQTSAFGPGTQLSIFSQVPLGPNPSPSFFGYAPFTNRILMPGRTYRISIDVRRVVGTPDQYGNPNFGLALLTQLSNNSRYWISPHRQPINVWQGGSYTFTYTVPVTETAGARIYLSVISRIQSGSPPTTQGCQVVVDNLRVKLMSQYEIAPMDGITLTEAFRQLLIVRMGLPDGCYSTADTEYLDEETGITLGVRWETTPNVAIALQELADTYCAVVFTDSTGVIRVKRYEDPALGTSVATLSSATINMKQIKIRAVKLPGLTTNFGCRRNCEPLNPGDYVTDTVTVPPTQREAWSGKSQIRFSSSKRPINEYSFAIGAPRFHMLCDEAGPAKREADRVLAMVQAKAAPSAGRQLFDTTEKEPPGKRMEIDIHARAQNGLLGEDATIATKDVMYGTILTLNLPEIGLSNKKVFVKNVSRAPFGDWIEFTGEYR